jgi:hypothetical protein
VYLTTTGVNRHTIRHNVQGPQALNVQCTDVASKSNCFLQCFSLELRLAKTLPLTVEVPRSNPRINHQDKLHTIITVQLNPRFLKRALKNLVREYFDHSIHNQLRHSHGNNSLSSWLHRASIISNTLMSN